MQLSQSARYIISGASSALTNLGFFYFLYAVCGIWYLLASVVAFCAALAVGFVLHAFWTFGQTIRGTTYRQLFLFTITALFNLVLNVGIVFVCVEWFDLWAVLAQILGGISVAFWNFFVLKHGIFVTLHEKVTN